MAHQQSGEWASEERNDNAWALSIIISPVLIPLVPAFHPIPYPGLAISTYYHRLSLWADFEQDVRAYHDSLFKSTQPLLPQNYTPKNGLIPEDAGPSRRRFMQQALEPVNAVADKMGLSVRFTDWRSDQARLEATHDLSNIDANFIVMDPAENVTRAMGKDRTVGGMALSIMWFLWRRGDDRRFRLFIGETAELMYTYQLRYGFVTTYKGTVFLKQEYINNDWVLFASNVIKETTASLDFTTDSSSLVDKISLRECLLYLLHLSESPDYKVNNTLERNSWVYDQILRYPRKYDMDSVVPYARSLRGYRGHFNWR